MTDRVACVDTITRYQAKACKSWQIRYAAAGSASNALHPAFIRNLVPAIDPAECINLCRGIANAHKSPPKYGNVSYPTLIIAGEEDRLFS